MRLYTLWFPLLIYRYIAMRLGRIWWGTDHEDWIAARWQYVMVRERPITGWKWKMIACIPTIVFIWYGRLLAKPTVLDGWEWAIFDGLGLAVRKKREPIKVSDLIDDVKVIAMIVAIALVTYLVIRGIASFRYGGWI